MSQNFDIVTFHSEISDVAAKDKEAQMSNYVAVDAMRSAKLNQLRQMQKKITFDICHFF